VFELLWLLATTALGWARPHNDLVLENLLLRHQLAGLIRPTRTRPRARLRLWDKVLWVLARRFCIGWREHLSIVSPDAVVRWHRQSWRLFWRWKSRHPGGLPHLSAELQALIATISRENRLWGTERLRGELLKLGIVVSNRSIRRYRWRGPKRPPSQTWRTFLARCNASRSGPGATGSDRPSAWPRLRRLQPERPMRPVRVVIRTRSLSGRGSAAAHQQWERR
jgi:hypothetical protein